MTKKITIKDILQAKNLIEENKNKPYYCELFGGEIEVEDIPVSKITQILNSATEDEPLRSDYELIYESCPIFRSKELQDELDIKDPIMVVEKAFGGNIFEIDKLAKFIMRRYGYFSGVETIKKQ